MGAFEENILAPVPGDDPCGPNLEYDAAYLALDRLMLGKPEQQIGATIVAAEEPDWKQVQKAAVELLGRSKDVRISFSLTNALLRLQGYPGLASGLAIIRGLIEQYWEGFHPRLDPDDDNDPTMRVNIIMGLNEPAMVNAVRVTPLVSSRALGRFTLKDVEMATGDAPPPAGAEAPQMATIEAAMLDIDMPTLEATAAGARGALEAIEAIEAGITDRVGAAAATNLSKITATLKRASIVLANGIAKRQPAAEEGGEAMANGDGASGGGVSAGGGPALAGEVRSRDDVVRALDKISGYYAKHEPSSPIPLFIDRCKRMVTMSFIDIVKDLVPDQVSQVEVLLKGRPE